MSLLDIFGVLANYLLNASPANMLASAKFGPKEASSDCRWVVFLQIGKYFSLRSPFLLCWMGVCHRA